MEEAHDGTAHEDHAFGKGSDCREEFTGVAAPAMTTSVDELIKSTDFCASVGAGGLAWKAGILGNCEVSIW